MKRLIVLSLMVACLAACNSEKNTHVVKTQINNTTLVKAEPIKKSAKKVVQKHAQAPLARNTQALTQEVVVVAGRINTHGHDDMSVGHAITNEIVVAATQPRIIESHSHMHGHPAIQANVHGHPGTPRVQVAGNDTDVVIYEHD